MKIKGIRVKYAEYIILLSILEGSVDMNKID